MLVRMGNPRPHSVIDGEIVVPDMGGAPVVYEHSIPLGDKGGYSVTMGDDVTAILRHLAQRTGLVTHLGEGHDALLAVVRTWPSHCEEPPTWVDVVPEGDEDPALVDDFERQVAEYFGAARKAPENVEATHWTTESAPPGVDSGRFATAQEA